MWSRTRLRRQTTSRGRFSTPPGSDDVRLCVHSACIVDWVDRTEEMAMTKLGTILDQIDAGSMLLPEFQRGYVWNRDQVRGLMRSLYRGYPVGALLVWEAADSSAQAVRGDVAVIPGTKSLLLDGQQRVTT